VLARSLPSHTSSPAPSLNSNAEEQLVATAESLKRRQQPTHSQPGQESGRPPLVFVSRVPVASAMAAQLHTAGPRAMCASRVPPTRPLSWARALGPQARELAESWRFGRPSLSLAAPRRRATRVPQRHRSRLPGVLPDAPVSRRRRALRHAPNMAPSAGRHRRPPNSLASRAPARAARRRTHWAAARSCGR